MIKTKNLAIMAVIIIILAALSFMQKSSHQKSTARPAMDKLIETELSVETLAKITLGRGSEDAIVTMIKNPDQSWTISSAWDAPGDASKIGNLLFNMKNLKGEFRSDKADVLKDYQLDMDQAVAVRGYGNTGDLAVEILVGKAPMGARGNFVRNPSENRVYLSQKNLLSPLGLHNGPSHPQNKNFINLTPLGIDKLAVDTIVLQNEGLTMELVKVFADPAPAANEGAPAPVADRNTWEWKLAQDSSVALAKTKVDGLMNSLLGLRAVDVDDPSGDKEGYGLKSATQKAIVVLEDGSSWIVEFGAQRPAGIGGSSGSSLPAGRWMQVHGENDIWIVTDLTVDNIFKDIEALQNQ